MPSMDVLQIATDFSPQAVQDKASILEAETFSSLVVFEIAALRVAATEFTDRVVLLQVSVHFGQDVRTMSRCSMYENLPMVLVSCQTKQTKK